MVDAGDWKAGGDIWPPGPLLGAAAAGDCSPCCVWLLMARAPVAALFFPPSAAVTMGFRLCMLKVSLRSNCEPRAVCLSLCRAQRSCRTKDRWQSGKSQWYICLGLSAGLASVWCGLGAEQLTVQLMAVQMLGSRVALPAAFMRTLKLLVEALAAPSALPRGALAVAVSAVGRVAFVAPVAAAASRVATLGGGGGGRLVGPDGRVHLVSKLRLDLAQLGRVPCMHGQDFRHRRRAGRAESSVAAFQAVRVSGVKVEGCVVRWRDDSRVWEGVSLARWARIRGGRACCLEITQWARGSG